MMPEEAGVVLGRSIGPFVLGQTLQTAVDVIRHHLPKHKAEVRYHEGEPSRHLLLLNACERDGASGFYVLRFDATLQLLIAVSYFPPLRVRLANTTSAGVGGGPSLPSTIGDLIDSFRQPGRWEATTLAGRKEEAVRCFYEGTCFVFRCVHGGGSREFKLDKGAAVSKSELIALHVTTHAGAPTYCLWGGVVSLSKLMPTHFGLLESRFVVEAVTRCARGIEMGAKSGDIIQVLFGATSQDVLRALGCPDNVWHKEDRHVSVDGHPIQRAGTVGVYFSYTRLGVSFLIDAKAHQVKKIVMHTNVPGYFEFCSYSRCNFKVSLTSGGLATDSEDSFLLMPETKWSTLVRNVDAACIRHLRRCLYKQSTNSYYPFPQTNLWVLFDQFLVETTSHDDIAKVTIVAPDWTTVTTRQLVVTRTSGNLLPVRDEVVPSGNGLGHLVGNVPGVHQLGHDDNSATGHAPASNDWRRSNERHTGVCCVEAHSSMSNDDDDELFCSAESSLEALRLSPASPASQDISHFCPSLNTLLAEVQREEAVVEVLLPHYNSVVYDFLDGPRVGVADDGAPRDAPTPLVISLSNMDSESGSMEGDGNDDALKTLQDEHTVVGVEDRAKDGLSPEDSLFEIVSHKELDEVPAPSRRTVAGTSLAGPDEHILSEGHTPMEGHALSGSHTSNEQLEARSTESKTPSPKREDHLQILYRPSISAATPSRLLSLSQDLGVVTRAREKGRQVGTAKMASTSTHASSHTSTQSEKTWGRLLGHTQSSERRVRQKYQPRTGEREGEELECAGGREVCEGAVCEDTGPENGTRPCLEGGGGEGVDQVSEARHQEAAQSEPHPPGSSGDLGMSCAARECQVVTDDMGCLRAGSIPQAAVLEGCLTREQLDTTQGSSGSPDPFASIPLPSCDPQLGLLRLMGHDQSPPLMGHGQSPPLVARRCWDSSEPHMPDYGPPSLDHNTAVFENISCEHNEMCHVLAVRHQVLVNLKDKVRMDPSSIPQEVLEHTLSGECDRSLLPAILEALNISITNTWDICLSISVLPLATELISEQTDLRHVVIGCNSILRVIDSHLHNLQLSNNLESPSDPVIIECLHRLKRVHLAIQALLPRLQEHRGTDARADDALHKLILVRENLNRVLTNPQVE